VTAHKSSYIQIIRVRVLVLFWFLSTNYPIQYLLPTSAKGSHAARVLRRVVQELALLDTTVFLPGCQFPVTLYSPGFCCMMIGSQTLNTLSLPFLLGVKRRHPILTCTQSFRLAQMCIICIKLPNTSTSPYPQGSCGSVGGLGGSSRVS
jgi:hypothetical protein